MSIIQNIDRHALVDKAVEVVIADELDDVDSSISTQMERQHCMDVFDNYLMPEEKASVIERVESHLKKTTCYASGAPYRYTGVSHHG